MIIRQYGILIACALALSACAATRSSSTVTKPEAAQAAVIEDRQPTDPAAIIITDDDITDRPYQMIGDVKVGVSKTTIFNEDPTPKHVDDKLRKRAAKLGADAVVLVRYGTVGVSLMSWGTLEGQGRAVYFTD